MSIIGKIYITKDSYIVVAGKSDNDFQKIDIKDKSFIIVDTIKTCGYYLYCETEDGYQFALLPDDIDKFEEIK